MVLVKRPSGQAVQDKPRKAYRIFFPSDLAQEGVATFLDGISGAMHRKPGIFSWAEPMPSLVFEVWATNQGIEHWLRVPSQYEQVIVPPLLTLIPGTRLVPDGEYPSRAWTKAVEVGVKNSHRQLHIADASALSANILARFAHLGKDETLMMQWAVTPATPRHKPIHGEAKTKEFRWNSLTSGTLLATKDEVTERRAKLDEHTFHAVLRVGAVASNPTRATHLIINVISAIKSAHSAANHLVDRWWVRDMQRRMDAGGSPDPLHPPILLNVSELTGVLAWPIGSPHVAGLPQSRSRHLPPSGAIPRRGLVVAQANFPGAERPLALSAADACKHLHIVGPTGVGKTVLAGNLVAQAVSGEAGVIVMERKGDLFTRALDAVPADRLDDVIIVDARDTHPVGYNLLSEGDPRIAVEEICQLFEYLYPDMRRGIWARAALHRGLSTLITRPGMTFIDLVPLLSPNTRSDVEQQWRDELIAEIKDPELARFWQRFDDLSPAQQENYAAPILDRMWQLNERPEIRNIIGQSESSFSFRGAIRKRRVVLVNLAGLGVETGRLAGTLLLNAIWSAVRGGAANPARPTYLFLDELQDFLNLPIDAESLLVQARSFGLSLVLAHQHLDQLPDSIRSAVLANARSKVVFQTTFDDARVFAREFGRAVSEEDLMNLGPYEVFCRFATGEGISAPVSGETLPPAEPKGLASEVRHRSRERYGRAAADITTDIARRRTPRAAPTPRKRPRLGGTTWK